MTMTFAIDPELSAARMAPVIRRFGRLHIPGFLHGKGAEDVVQALDGANGWMLSTRGETSTVDIPVEAFAAADAPARAALLAGARQQARTGFHYLFETLRISDLAEAGDDLPPILETLYRWLNGPTFLGFAAELSGMDDLRYVDAQATRFRPGHYLTEHDDDKPDAGRRLAYVLNLTPGWRTSWGGLLGFVDADGHLAEAYTPAFNALNLFVTPQPHLVTQVADFADRPRLSITGWVRTRR